MRYLVKGLALVTLVAGIGGSAGAQQTSATPWRAFLGCWSAGEATPRGLDAAQPIICVTPTQNSSAALFTTIADGKVTATQTVDASGRSIPLDAKDCTGTQNARWSADGRRVYLNSVASCDGVTRTTTGILAMTPSGEWLDIQGVRAGGEENVHVARYRDIGVRSNVPAEIAEALSNNGMAVQTARSIAGAAIGTAGVVEASAATDVAVAEAFVLERGQQFHLDAKQLVALADAGVSPRLTDAMIAVSNPQHFAVNRPDATTHDVDDVGARRVYVTLDRYSPWGWGYGAYGYRPYGYYYDPYAYGLYGSYYGGGYGGGYGYPGYYSGGPIVVVRGSEQQHGRMVKGRGYEQGDRPTPAASSATARERESSRSTGSLSSGSSSSDSSRPSSSSGSSGSTEQRTAKPRP